MFHSSGLKQKIIPSYPPPVNQVMCSGGEPRAGDGGTRNADGEAERGEEGGGQAASAAGGTGTTCVQLNTSTVYTREDYQ
jgi:hypothetical protein